MTSPSNIEGLLYMRIRHNQRTERKGRRFGQVSLVPTINQKFEDDYSFSKIRGRVIDGLIKKEMGYNEFI